MALRRLRLAAAIRGSLPRAERSGDLAHPAITGAALLALSVAFAAPARATVYTVNTLGDPGPNGSLSLRQAVFQANGSSNNIVQFATTLPVGTITLTSGEIPINQAMYIAGPGIAKLTISGNDASGIFNIDNTGAGAMSVTLTGLTLTHGAAARGGAVSITNTSVTLQHSVISGSYAGGGGAFYATGAPSVTLDDVTIANNRAYSAAGGVAVINSGTTQINNSVIRGNTAHNCGGVAVDGYLVINNSQITGNSASTKYGGGMCGYSFRIYDSLISGNTAARRGGGIYAQGNSTSTSKITRTQIIGNSAVKGGGGIGVTIQSMTIVQSTISGNTAGSDATSYGGGIDVQQAKDFVIKQSLISYNNAVSQYTNAGGGIAFEKPLVSVEIDETTIMGNYAFNDAGGISIVDSETANKMTIRNSTIVSNFTAGYGLGNGIFASSGTPFLTGCIVANNSSRGVQQDLEGHFSSNYSLIKTPGSATVVATNNLPTGVDPKLGPLKKNGGPTLSMLPAIDSPVLNAGNPTPVSVADQRGLPRVANARADIGAVERQYPEDYIFRDGFGDP